MWWCSVKSGGVILAFIVTQFSCLGNLQVVRGSFKEKPLTMPKGCSLTTLFVFFFLPLVLICVCKDGLKEKAKFNHKNLEWTKKEMHYLPLN